MEYLFKVLYAHSFTSEGLNNTHYYYTMKFTLFLFILLLQILYTYSVTTLNLSRAYLGPLYF